MPRSRSRLWLVAASFVALALIIVLMYRHLRAGHIQAAEGRQEYDVGRFDLAEAAYQRATRADPDNAEAWYWLGISRKNQGLAAPAADALGKATSLSPDRITWWSEYAEALQWTGRFDLAEAAYQRVTRADPENAEAWYSLGISRKNQGLSASAAAALAKATSLNSELTTWWFEYAEVLQWAGRFKLAEAAYQRVNRADPENAEAWYCLGISRKNQGLSATAADALAKATLLNSERTPWWFEYAEVLYWAGRFDMAEAAYQRVTQADPENAEAWYWLGISRKNQGLSASAADALGKATSLSPDRVTWWFEYAEALQWVERFSEAETAWQKVMQLLPPDHPRLRQARVNLARSMGGQGGAHVDRAVRMLEEVLAKNEDRRVRFALAEVLAWAGRLEESKEQYRRALNSQREE